MKTWKKRNQNIKRILMETEQISFIAILSFFDEYFSTLYFLKK